MANGVWAQFEDCSDIPSSAAAQAFYTMQSNFEGCEVQVKLYYHLYYDNNGNNGVPVDRPDEMTTLLNQQYAGTGITFFHNNCETRVVNNSVLDALNDNCDFFFQGNEHGDGIDLHVKDDNNGFRGVASGIPGGELYHSGTWNLTGDPLSLSQTLGHEMGHCLGLFHTHHGTCTEGGGGCLGGGGDPTQSAANGDYVDDTPRDPHLGGGGGANVDAVCNWNGNIICNDGMGDFNPLTDNFMAYTRVTRRTNFTMGQIVRMCELMWPNIAHTNDIVCCNLTEMTPQVSTIMISNECPSLKVNLDDYLDDQIPLGTQLIWSTDNDPSDGVFPHLSSITSENGIYYAYFHLVEEDCYSQPSDPIEVTITSCCDDETNFIISNTYITSDQDLFGGNIIIQSGGELIVQSGHTIYMGQDKSIIVEDGGKLTIESDATIQPCPDADYWKGITVKDGGESDHYGHLVLAREGYDLEAGAQSHFLGGSINGVANSKNNVPLEFEGIKTTGHVRILVDGITITKYNKAIECTDANSYFYINDVTTSTVKGGIYLHSSPASITNCHIRLYKSPFSPPGIPVFRPLSAIYANGSSGSFIDHNDCNGNISILYSPSTRVENNIIDNFSIGSQIYVYSTTDCTVKYNKVTASQNGIRLVESEVNCTGNEVELSGGANSWNSGIYMSTVSNSQIKNNSIIAPNTFSGIFNAYGSDNEIYNNTIYGDKYGIRLDGSTSEEIRDNIIDASYGRGISALNSPDAEYECNEISSISWAVDVRSNSEGQDFWHNYFSGGADLQINSVIGIQELRGNEFVGSYVVSNLASFENALSRFIVNPSYQYHRPNVIVAASDWFQNDPSVSYYECSGTPGAPGFWDEDNWDGMCSHYLHLLNTYGPGSPQMTLFLLNAERAIGWTGKHFSTSCIGDPWPPHECEEKIIEIEKMILDGPIRSTSSTTLSSMLDNLKSESRPTDMFLEQLEGASNLVNSDYLYARQSYLQDLKDAQVELETMNCNSNEVIRVSTEILIEYINYNRMGREYNYSRMLPYARLCADRYGRLVHIARMAVSEFVEENFDQYDNCDGREEIVKPRTNNSISSHILYPNPSSGQFTLQFEVPTSADIVIKDISGRLIKNISVNESRSVKFDLYDYNGVHFIHVLNKDGSTQVHKAIVIK